MMVGDVLYMVLLYGIKVMLIILHFDMSFSLYRLLTVEEDGLLWRPNSSRGGLILDIYLLAERDLW